MMIGSSAQKAKRKRGAPATTTALGLAWAKRALYEYCFRVASGDLPAATDQLRSQLCVWSQRKAMFLVRHIYKQAHLANATKHRHSAMAAYVAWHRQQEKTAAGVGFPDGSRFEQYAARAFVYSVGLRINDSVWALFPELAQAVATEVPLRPANSREWNQAEVAASPAASLIVGGGGDDPELTRCEGVAQRRVYSVVASGLPAVAQVRELIDRHTAEQYRERIDELDEALQSGAGANYCGPSIDDALIAGKERRWTTVGQVQSRLALFYMLCDAHLDSADGLPPAMRVAELYQQYAKKRASSSSSKAVIAKAETDRAQAAAYGFWRIRRDEEAMWQAALSGDEWRDYQASIAQVPRGVLMHVRRRRFNADSLAKMRTANLAQMRSAFSNSASSASSAAAASAAAAK